MDKENENVQRVITTIEWGNICKGPSLMPDT